MVSFIGGILAGQEAPPASTTVSVSPGVRRPIQRDLFDTRPWTPEKILKPTAEHLYLLIQAMSSKGKQCFASARWFASKFKVSARTIFRWLLELSKRVTVNVRPGKTSIFCTVGVEKMSRVDVIPAPVGPLLNSSSIPEAGKARLSPRVRAALVRATRRIVGAKNPEAYRRAIIGVESRLEALQDAPELPKRRQPSSADAATPWRPVSGGLADHLTGLGLSIPAALFRRLA